MGSFYPSGLVSMVGSFSTRQRKIIMQNQNSQQQNVSRLAKLAVTRPEAVVRELTQDGESGARELRALRAYPMALVALWRAENAPRDMRVAIEDELEAVGFQMMS